MINPVPRGSKVGIVSPSSALDSPEDIRDGLRWLESCGYRVVLGTHVYDRLNHMAGTPEQQAEDLMRFFADPEIKAVFAAAGGFGAQYDIKPSDIDEKLFSGMLYTGSAPDADLIIRTSGELRLSNFLLWQAAYAELYSTDVLWPDFNEKELDKALEAYASRSRRFGGV